MAQTPEGKVKDKAKELYKKHGAKYDRSVMTGMGQNGRPDDLVCRSPDGHFGGVEYKRDNVFVVSALQRVWLQGCERTGGSSLVINLTNLDLLEKWLEQPGWRLNAQFVGERCVAHVASCPGHQPVTIKNPGTKPGKQSIAGQ